MKFVLLLLGLMSWSIAFGATSYLRECGDLNIDFKKDYIKISDVQINQGLAYGCDFKGKDQVVPMIEVFYQNAMLEENKDTSRKEEELISEFYAHEKNIYRLEVRSIMVGLDKVWCFDSYSEHDEGKKVTECYFFKKKLKIGVTIPSHELNNFDLGQFINYFIVDAHK